MRLKRLTMLFLVFLCAAAPASGEYAILCPSQAESVLAPGRDFYVVAFVPGDAAEARVTLTNDAGVVVRELTGGDQPVFLTEYERLNAFYADRAEYGMPDLIVRPGAPDSLYDGSIKCYVKDGTVLAVIAGGQYKMDGRALTDKDGAPYAPLPAGAYTLAVEAGGMTLKRRIVYGETEDKVMARFSPDGHLERVGEKAEADAYRAYLDPLPGYWSPSAFLPAQRDNPYFAEIKDRWQLADAMEYMAGAVHFFVYNLSETCATLTVELAALQLDGAVDTRMKPYHYDIGEPLLAYGDGATAAYLMGELTPFAAGDRLVITRAEISEAAVENTVNLYADSEKTVDLDVRDGVTAAHDRKIALHGVVCPIQNAPGDMKRLSESAWETGNRVTQIEYSFACGEKAWTERRDVRLTRLFGEDWRGESLYEFAHVFSFDASFAGREINVSLRGIDANGQAVAGTRETIIFAITGD